MPAALIDARHPMSDTRVAGLPAVGRAVLLARRAGLDPVLVLVAPGNATAVRSALDADRRTRGTPTSLELPAFPSGEVTILQAPHVLSPRFLLRLPEPSEGSLRASAGGIVGAIRVAAGDLATTGMSGRGAMPFPESAEALFPDLPGRELAGERVVVLRQPSDVGRAERELCTRMQEDSRESDGPIARRVSRRLSLPLSRWLVRHTPLRPNHITTVGTGLGLFAGWLLSRGTWETGVLGTFLFVAAAVIDGCDGEVARLTLRESKFGQYYDVATDNLVHVAIFLGLGVGQRQADPQGPWLALLALLLGGFAFTGGLSWFFLVRRPDFADPDRQPRTRRGRLRQRLLAGMKALMNRDFAWLLLALALVDRLAWFVWSAAFGSWVFGLLLVLVYRWREETGPAGPAVPRGSATLG